MKLIFALLVLSALLCMTGCAHKRTMKDCEQIWKLNPDSQKPEPTNKSWCSDQFDIWN